MRYDYTNERMSFLEEKDEERLGIIESILFAAGDAVDCTRLREQLSLEEEDLRRLIGKLEERLKSPSRGVSLLKTQESLRLVSKSSYYAQTAAVLGRTRKKILGRAMSEVLAVVAYQQPVTRVEIDAVRGVGSASALQRLIDAGIVEEAGRLEAPGHPYLYRTTTNFLELAGINSLSELPEYEQFHRKKG